MTCTFVSVTAFGPAQEEGPHFVYILDFAAISSSGADEEGAGAAVGAVDAADIGRQVIQGFLKFFSANGVLEDKEAVHPFASYHCFFGEGAAGLTASFGR